MNLRFLIPKKHQTERHVTKSTVSLQNSSIKSDLILRSISLIQFKNNHQKVLSIIFFFVLLQSKTKRFIPPQHV